MTNQPENLETIVANQSSKKKIGIVDTAGNITYSLIVGTALDYCAGLNGAGIVVSRVSATAMNTVTGGPYGWWREQAYRITRTEEEDRSILRSLIEAYVMFKNDRGVLQSLREPAVILGRKVRETIVDVLAFNTFQVPVYAAAVAIGSFLSEGKVNWDKVQDGTTYLTTISPFIGPTMGWYMDVFRRLFGVKSAAEGAYKK